LRGPFELAAPRARPTEQGKTVRKKKRFTDIEAATALLKRAAYVELATSTGDGTPVLRTLNGVVVDDWMMFHGAFAGEKSDCFERAAVISAYEVIADIPSYFVDEKKACPATTYFQSVQAKGTLTNIPDPELKVKALQALMDKMQPEGGFLPFSHDLEFYKKDLKSTRVFGVRLSEITGKASLGQDKPPEFTEKIVRGLFRRGKARDLKAIGRILESSPKARPAEWTIERDGAEPLFVEVQANADRIDQHTALLDGAYWKKGCEPAEIRAAIESSSAWVGLATGEGKLVAAARATADRIWMANIFDVIVHADYRGQGLGKRLMGILLEHPMVRDCKTQRLGTMDAMDFYASLGFTDPGSISRDFVSHPMVRVQP